MDAFNITGAFPAVWVSDVDATDAAAGIHCGRIPEPLGRAGAGIAKRLIRLVDEL